MDPALGRVEAPTAELLLDVRTPAELSFSPDGSRIAFALHATVADVGSFVPSDLFTPDVDGDEPPAAHEGRVERPDARLVTRRLAPRVPLGSDHPVLVRALVKPRSRSGPRRSPMS